MVDQAFSKEGVLSALLSGYHPNPLQIDYAHRVAQTLIEGEAGVQTSLTLLEGETGIGKSLAYLIPLMLYMVQSGRRAVISTYTLQLQNQLVQENGDLLLALAVTKSIAGRCPSYGVRKGMRNFVSVERVETVVKSMQKGASAGKQQELSAFKEWSKTSISGDLQEWVEQTGGLPEGVTVEQVSLSPLERTGTSVERYQLQVNSSRNVDLLLVTHAMLVRHARHWLKHLGNEERPVELLVVDEADRLGQAEESLYTCAIDLNGVADMVVEVEHGDHLVECCRSAVATVRVVCNSDKRFVDVMKLPVVAQSRLLEVVEGVYQVVLRVLHQQELHYMVQERLYELLGDLREYVGAVRGDVGYGEGSRLAVVDFRGGEPALRLLPLETGRLLYRLWRNENGSGLLSCLITSATLGGRGKSGHGSVDYLRESIRLPVGRARLNEHLSGALVPDQFGRASYCLPDPRVVLPSGPVCPESDEWVGYVVQMITAAKESGRVLVLTTSFCDSQTIAKRCDDVEVIAHAKGVKLSILLSRFLSQKQSVLISPIAWEGVDLPGAVDHLIICKLPFVPPDSPYLLAQEVRYHSIGRSKKALQRIQYEYQLNQAVRKFRQGLGRGIRRYDDECTVWIADPRFPVPEAKLRAEGVRCEKRTVHHAFASCIPERFRSGPMSSWASAKIVLKN
jgi:ATP-dependent DNA helicase DinG